MARPLFLTALAISAATAAQAGAQTAPYGDRYGPGPATPAQAAPYGYGQPSSEAQAAAPQAPSVFRGRLLAWPGKVEPRAVSTPSQTAAAPTAYAGPGLAPRAVAFSAPVSAPPGRYATAAAPAWGRLAQPMPRPPMPESQTPTARQALPTRPGGASSSVWRPVFAAAGPPPTQAAVRSAPPPTSIYAAPTPAYSPALEATRAAPPNRAWAADRRYGYDPTQNHSVRFYSVARPFGLRPDPAPIPPQFFTATADLGGDPAGPLPVNHTTATQRAAAVGGGDSGGQ